MKFICMYIIVDYSNQQCYISITYISSDSVLNLSSSSITGMGLRGVSYAGNTFFFKQDQAINYHDNSVGTHYHYRCSPAELVSMDY
jgi:hypothetical protein